MHVWSKFIEHRRRLTWKCSLDGIYKKHRFTKTIINHRLIKPEFENIGGLKQNHRLARKWRSTRENHEWTDSVTARWHAQHSMVCTVNILSFRINRITRESRDGQCSSMTSFWSARDVRDMASSSSLSDGATSTSLKRSMLELRRRDAGRKSVGVALPLTSSSLPLSSSSSMREMRPSAARKQEHERNETDSWTRYAASSDASRAPVMRPVCDASSHSSCSSVSMSSVSTCRLRVTASFESYFDKSSPSITENKHIHVR